MPTNRNELKKPVLNLHPFIINQIFIADIFFAIANTDLTKE